MGKSNRTELQNICMKLVGAIINGFTDTDKSNTLRLKKKNTHRKDF